MLLTEYILDPYILIAIFIRIVSYDADSLARVLQLWNYNLRTVISYLFIS